MSNFYSRFAQSAERWPQNIALELQPQSASGAGERFTYAELRTRAEAVGAWLRAQQLPPGARCAILANNGPRWVAAYLGVLAAGCVAVPLDTAFKAEQIAKLLGDSGTALLFVDARHLPLAQRALEKHPAPLVLLDTAIPVASPEHRLEALRQAPSAADLQLPKLDDIFAANTRGFDAA